MSADLQCLCKHCDCSVDIVVITMFKSYYKPNTMYFRLEGALKIF